MLFVLSILSTFLQLLTWVIIIQALLSFVLSPLHPVRQTIDRLLEPLYRPIRQFMPATGGLDFSPMVLIIIIFLIRSLLSQLAFTL